MDNVNDRKGLPGADEAQRAINPVPRSLFAEDNPEQTPQDRTTPQEPLPQEQSGAKSKSSVFTRIVLPAAVFIIGIACIAWVTQYLPSRGHPQPAAKPGEIQFTPATFVWNPNENGEPADKKYTIPEFELGIGGHYDYQFSNTSDGDIELGVSQTSCTCTGVTVCIFQSSQDRAKYEKDKDARDLVWTKLEVDKELRSRVNVPAHAAGALRISWNGAKTEPELVRLTTKVWTRAGHGQDTREKNLLVLVNYVHPAKFFPERIDLGTLGPKEWRTASFNCWSATRDLDVKPIGNDKLLEVAAQKLDANQCRKLQDEMRAHDLMTRIVSAYKITVTLQEEKDGQQLDMGLFYKPIPLAITSEGEPIDVAVPMVRANVLGDVTLGPEEEGGRIDFKFFRAKERTTKKVTLFAPKDTKLSFVRCEPVLLDLDVALKQVKTVGDKMQWQMDVSTKLNRDPGMLPENGVLVLQCESPGATRLVRIHVLGTAESRH
jgi:hypothetical protein